MTQKNDSQAKKQVNMYKVLSTCQTLVFLMLSTPYEVESIFIFNLHFTDKETETQKDRQTCSRSCG